MQRNPSNNKPPKVTQRQRLEEEKLKLEIRELNTPWFKKPAFLVPIVGTVSSVIILWVTGFFDTKIQTLNLKLERLSMEAGRLETTKSQLQQDSIKLDSTKKSLQIDTASLKKKILEYEKQDSTSRKILEKYRDESTKMKAAVSSITNKMNLKQEEFEKQSDSISKQLDTIKNALAGATSNLEIATKPYVTIVTYAAWSEKNVGIYVINNGTGVAFFKHINFYYKNKSFITDTMFRYTTLLEALNINYPWVAWTQKYLSDSISIAGALAPGKGYFILNVVPEMCDQIRARQFINAIRGLDIEFEYFSAKNVSTKRRIQVN